MDIKVKYLPEASEFLLTIDDAAAKKLVYNVSKVCSGIKDANIFKKLENTNIWEFRALNNGNCYRLLSFWDSRIETLIVATYGIMKKTQKTPKKEIEKAETIRKNYFDNN